MSVALDCFKHDDDEEDDDYDDDDGYDNDNHINTLRMHIVISLLYGFQQMGFSLNQYFRPVNSKSFLEHVISPVFRGDNTDRKLTCPVAQLHVSLVSDEYDTITRMFSGILRILCMTHNR